MKKLNDAVDRFAYHHPNFGIPNLMKFIVAGNVIVFLLLRLSDYSLYGYLGFNWGQVLHLRLWRVVRSGARRNSTSIISPALC